MHLDHRIVDQAEVAVPIDRHKGVLADKNAPQAENHKTVRKEVILVFGSDARRADLIKDTRICPENRSEKSDLNNSEYNG
jgi:hypothetical protein